MTQARKRFLLVVGLPKSGTTFLYSQAQRFGAHFHLPRGNKEVDYFRRGNSLQEYLSLFHDDGDKVCFDASPLYIDNVSQTIGNVKAALEGHDVKVVLCLRDPLERAYSHYLHDVATHQKLLGHAEYSFYSPTVFSQYIFPLQARAQALQNAFGAENVFGFVFGADNGRLENTLRDFANLPQDWGFDFKHNPAPGFTSPQTFYNNDQDTTIFLNGSYYLLPKGQILVVNRQFSIHRPNINPDIAMQIMARQNSITRSLDTGLIHETSRERIADDYLKVGKMLGLTLSRPDHPRVMHSQLSNDLPEALLARLKRVGDLNEAVAFAFSDGLRTTAETTVKQSEPSPSLPRLMSRLELARTGNPAESETALAIRDIILNQFGPIPLYAEGKARRLCNLKRFDDIEVMFAPYGGADKLIWPIDLAKHLQATGRTLPDDIVEQLRRVGVHI